MANIINGRQISKDIKNEIKEVVSKLPTQPALAVVLVGEDPASQVYVNNKKKACEEVGIRSVAHELPADTPEEDIINLIIEMNNDPSINGILVQLPLPSHVDEEKVLLTIQPEKDADGFHPFNVGMLSIGNPTLPSCTPAGIIELIERSGVEIEGKECVVLGRSNIVGKPVAQLLLNKHGTVTVCHSRTKDIASVAKRADILVAAVGVPEMVTKDFIKEGAVVIDVGIHRNENNKLTGDVKYDEVEPIAGYITPVPGGVGPMTIAMLMKNTLRAYQAQNK